MLTVVPEDCPGTPGEMDGLSSMIEEIVREGARRMLAEALQAEVEAYIAGLAAERDENGRRLVVRNGYHQSREVLTSAGAVRVTVPRVNDKRTDPVTGSGSGSPRRSCRRGRARPRRSPRCCRCCTCMACRPGTSCPRWASSSARRPGCHRRGAPGRPRPGRPGTARSPARAAPARTYVTLGATGSPC